MQRLSLAALALPGLLPGNAQADDSDALGFQYEHYAEGHRQLHGYNTRFTPLTVDSLRVQSAIDLAPRWHVDLNFEQDIWAGATPVTSLPLAAMTHLDEAQITAGASARPSTGQLLPTLVDADLHTYVDTGDQPFQPRYARDNRVIHMMTSASPETRKQGQGALGYAWDGAALSAGGGVSYEPDHAARFVSLSAEFDFNRKLTILAASVSRTWAETAVTLPDAWQGWVDTRIGESLDEIRSAGSFANGSPKYVVRNRRRDWAANLSVTQVLGRLSLAQLTAGYTRNAGYLENSYRVESFLTRGQLSSRHASDGTPLYLASLYHSYEQRPDERNQWFVNLRLVQHLPGFEAALHGDYRYFRDDWGITAHSVETSWEQPLGSGWSVTPQLRYYSQSAAAFYRPFVLCGSVAGADCAQALRNYSSDYRLSGYGALSAGLALVKRVARGVSLELSGDYYTHRGALKLGRGGERDYADFSSYALNAALRIDSTALAAATDNPYADHHHADPQHARHAHRAPPAVMAAHALHRAGDLMLGYRYMFAGQSGDMRHGTKQVEDGVVVAQGGCDSPGCSVRPHDMHMHMHMLEVMYAVSDSVTLMLAPQFIDMNMALTPLVGGPPSIHSSHGAHHSGGVGDTELAALTRLIGTEHHQITAALGLSAPSGEADLRLNPVAGHSHDPSTVKQPDYLHYGMQLGSGSWDLVPRLTYSGASGVWHWGAQLGGIKRLARRNAAGYALGDQVHATSWATFDVSEWLSLSLRTAYTGQGKVRGGFRPHTERNIASAVISDVPNARSGPMDAPGNYGGAFWDLGVGVELHPPRGAFAGSTLALEWLQPVADDIHGYQLERAGGLVASFSRMF